MQPTCTLLGIANETETLTASTVDMESGVWLNPLLDPEHGFGASCSERSSASVDFEGSELTYISKIEDSLIFFPGA